MAAVFEIILLPDIFAVCRLPPDSSVPTWVKGRSLMAVIRTANELSVVVEQKYVPKAVLAERDWRAIYVKGPLDFSLIGVLASLSETLAAAKVSIFALSTYNTDYLLLKKDNLLTGLNALRDAGHKILDR